MSTGEPERLYKDDWRYRKENQDWIPWILEIKSYLKPISSYFGSNSTFSKEAGNVLFYFFKITWSIVTLLPRQISQRVLCLRTKELHLGTSKHGSPSLPTSIHSEWVQPTSVEWSTLKSWLSFLGPTLIRRDNKGTALLACTLVFLLLCVK